MIRRMTAVIGGTLLICLFGVASVIQPARADERAAGKAVYKKANCIGCHKWHGMGGGGYGGAALSLRNTLLEREFLIEVIRCGRPATRMPFHDRHAWKQGECFGATLQALGSNAPPDAAKFLRPPEIEAVADYVLSALKGRDEPTKDECVAFWGAQARECTRF